MRRTTLHLMVDILLLVSMLGLIMTGLLMGYVLPSGSRGSTVFGWTRHDWGDVHFWIANAMFVVVALHLLLNWSWVCNATAKAISPRGAVPGRGLRNLSGAMLVLLLLAVIGVWMWAAQNAKVDIPYGGRGLEQEVDEAGPGRGQGMGWGRIQRDAEQARDHTGP